MILAIRTQVQVTEQNILAGGEHPIRGGATLHFTGPGYAFSNAVILTLERGEEAQ